jgi:tetratricopeptide (TPR) repeat protein
MARIRHTTLAWLALLLAGGVTALAVPHAAAEADEQPAPEAKDEGSLWQAEQEQREAASRVIEPRTARILVKARAHLLAEEYDQAQKVIDKVDRRRANRYERALAARIKGYIAYGRQDPEAAVALLREALVPPEALPRSDRADVLFQIAQIESSQGKWAEAVETLKEWFATAEQPGSAAYFQLGLAYYQLKDVDAALEPARKAVELSDSPSQPCLQLLLSVYLSRQDYVSATPVLLDLLSRYPTAGKNYWLQLSTLYGIQGDTPRALAVLELVHRQGLLSEDRELRRLAQLSLAQGLPLRAARLAETAIDQQTMKSDAEAYELVANGWILAREAPRARQALARAAESSADGQLYARLGQVLMLDEEWDAAVAVLEKALAKGGLEDESKVALLLGIAHFSADRSGEARAWFARARRSESSRVAATEWLEYLESELRARRARGDSVG